MYTDNNSHDMLRRLFAMQADLNNHVFRTHNITDDAGNVLSMQAICDAAQADKLQVNDLPARWLANYCRAMQAEVAELQEELPWKWWSRDPLDMQNIRVELIDILHFLVSCMLSAGLTPDEVYAIYRQKHAVNMNRQDTGYSKATKTEEDNRQIG